MVYTTKQLQNRYKKYAFIATPKRRKKRPTKASLVKLVRQPQVISNSTIVTLRYSENVTLDAGITTKAYDTWRANDIFDPYVGLGGHQPLGADEWATFYNHFTVLGSKITATYFAASAGAANAAGCVVKVSDTGTWLQTNLDTIIEQNRSKVGHLMPLGSGRDMINLVAYYNPKTFFGVTNPSDEHDLRGITGGGGASPTEQAYFHCGTSATAPGDNPGPINLRILIEYKVLFTERKDLNGS